MAVAYDITADGDQVDMHHFLPLPNFHVQTESPGAAMVIGSEIGVWSEEKKAKIKGINNETPVRVDRQRRSSTPAS